MKEEHTLSHEEFSSFPQTEEGKVKQETEEQRVKMREEERERKRRGVMERMKRLSLSTSEADEPFSPLSTTLMISERTESLSRSVKKSNSVKKTEPPVTISRIESRLEQYNHAVELCGQNSRDTKPGLMDLPTSPEPLAVRKNLFEEGQVWNQNQNQKVLASKPDEVTPGDVRHIKTLWETLETSAQAPGGKASSGKRFKFVETGYGKYERILVGDSDDINYTNEKQSQQDPEDL
ncbi:lymphocyte specific protein 1 b [Brachyhypopomus gauderio]|uniref:lymphocyte specific protein 1 b n=1 Tax=Brachyhypopomus gauderio TaxID=698409 RepID=UPI0040413A7A